MSKMIREFLKTAGDPIPDSTYGNSYRCSAYLIDGLFLPCVLLRASGPAVDLAVRRFEEERHGKGLFRSKDSYKKIVRTFIATGNRINSYDIAKLETSRYAIPLSVLRQIEVETTMSWTGFVLEMKDGALFAYGTTFAMEFFDIPEGYAFSDVVAVHNHAYVSPGGELVPLRRGLAKPPDDYKPSLVCRERPYFVCYYDG